MIPYKEDMYYGNKRNVDYDDSMFEERRKAGYGLY